MNKIIDKQFFVYTDGVAKDCGHRIASDVERQMQFDYEKLADKRDNHYYSKTNGKRLISASAINKIINTLELGSIDETILNRRREFGNVLMRSLKIMKDTNWDVDNLSVMEQTKIHLNAIKKWLDLNEVKIEYVDKFICNDHFCGIVDLIIRLNKCKTKSEKQYAVVELKLRNSLDMKPQDEIQLALYCKLLGVSRGVLLIVDDMGNVKEYVIKVTGSKVIKWLEWFNKTYNKKLTMNRYYV